MFMIDNIRETKPLVSAPEFLMVVCDANGNWHYVRERYSRFLIQASNVEADIIHESYADTIEEALVTAFKIANKSRYFNYEGYVQVGIFDLGVGNKVSHINSEKMVHIFTINDLYYELEIEQEEPDEYIASGNYDEYNAYYRKYSIPKINFQYGDYIAIDTSIEWNFPLNPEFKK